MFTSKENLRQAIVVLPPAMSGRISDSGLRRWLSRASLEEPRSASPLFGRILTAAGITPPDEGLAALRLWGQTGDRPNVWVAAADPVHLEPRLDHLCLHALLGPQSPNTDLRAIFDFLQSSLGQDSAFAFARIGKHGYLRGDDTMSTAAVPAASIDGLEPDEYLPAGEAAAAYHMLTSELQMALHEHEVNLRRESEGLMPVNSIWLWGGGKAPEKTVRILPPLFGEDPLLQGFWGSCTGVVAPWPGNFSECADFALRDFVVLTPDSDEDDQLCRYLEELRGLLKSRVLDCLVLLFRDGLTARFGRFDAFRFWRRTSGLL